MAGLAVLCAITAGVHPDAAARAQAAARQPVVVGLHAHVARLENADGGQQPVQSDASVAVQVAKANEIFDPYGVAFRVVQTVPLGPRHARMETRRDRDALGAMVNPGVIDVFFVASLRDVDEPARMRHGVHWRSRAHPPAHYVIVAQSAFAEVLAHELGHFLGNRRHSRTPGNLMSYTRRPVLPFLDAGQRAKLEQALAHYLDSGELRALPPDPGPTP